jgi:hypothetical protein
VKALLALTRCRVLSVVAKEHELAIALLSGSEPAFALSSSQDSFFLAISGLPDCHCAPGTALVASKLGNSKSPDDALATPKPMSRDRTGACPLQNGLAFYHQELCGDIRVHEGFTSIRATIPILLGSLPNDRLLMKAHA